MKKSAFTLIEILIVVVLLGILAAVVIPQFAESADSANLVAANDLQDSLNKAAQYYRLKESAASWTALQAMTAAEAVTALNGAGYLDEDTATVPEGYALAWGGGLFSVSAAGG